MCVPWSILTAVKRRTRKGTQVSGWRCWKHVLNSSNQSKRWTLNWETNSRSLVAWRTISMKTNLLKINFQTMFLRTYHFEYKSTITKYRLWAQHDTGGLILIIIFKAPRVIRVIKTKWWIIIHRVTQSSMIIFQGVNDDLIAEWKNETQF